MNAPKIIYLQQEDEAAMPFDDTGPTWCEDRVNDSDVEYIRADLLESEKDSMIKLISRPHLRRRFEWAQRTIKLLMIHVDKLEAAKKEFSADVADVIDLADRLNGIVEGLEKQLKQEREKSAGLAEEIDLLRSVAAWNRRAVRGYYDFRPITTVWLAENGWELVEDRECEGVKKYCKTFRPDLADEWIRDRYVVEVLFIDGEMYVTIDQDHRSAASVDLPGVETVGDLETLFRFLAEKRPSTDN
jgi:hypothetical protein